MTLSEDSVERISLLYGVAKSQGSLISVKELVPLLSERTTEGELIKAITSFPVLNSRFELRAGYVTEKQTNREQVSVLEIEKINRSTALINLRLAGDFMPYLRSNPFKMVSISGSTSYHSASSSKDLDFFCVAPRSRAWLCLTQALMLARAYRFIHPEAPKICFSCVMAEDFANSVFGQVQGPLFARDALETIVIRGKAAYASLLGRAGWMSSLFPTAYDLKIRESDGLNESTHQPSILNRVLNKFLFLTVSGYIKAKSGLLNRRLAGAGKTDDIFRVRASESYLIYESKRYLGLAREYSDVLSERTDAQN